MEKPKVELTPKEIAELRERMKLDKPEQIALGFAAHAEGHAGPMLLMSSMFARAMSNNQEQQEAYSRQKGEESLELLSFFIAELLRNSEVMHEKLIEIAAFGCAHAGMVRAGMHLAVEHIKNKNPEQ